MKRSEPGCSRLGFESTREGAKLKIAKTKEGGETYSVDGDKHWSVYCQNCTYMCISRCGIAYMCIRTYMDGVIHPTGILEFQIEYAGNTSIKSTSLYMYRPSTIHALPKSVN